MKIKWEINPRLLLIIHGSFLSCFSPLLLLLLSHQVHLRPWARSALGYRTLCIHASQSSPAPPSGLRLTSPTSCQDKQSIRAETTVVFCRLRLPRRHLLCLSRNGCNRIHSLQFSLRLGRRPFSSSKYPFTDPAQVPHSVYKYRTPSKDPFGQSGSMYPSSRPLGPLQLC